MRKILVIREPNEFSRILAENGFEIINLPMIETKQLDDLSDFEAKLKDVSKFDGIFVTSKNAAQILVQKLDELKTSFAGKVYVLGKRSFEILRSKRLDLVFFNNANTAEEMLEKISTAELKNKKFLFVRGKKSLRIVPEFLSNSASVDETIVYETREIELETDKINDLREQFENDEFAAVCFFSPSAAETFLTTFGAENLHQIKIATIGKTTADFFQRRNLKVDFVSSKSSAENFAIDLINFL